MSKPFTHVSIVLLALIAVLQLVRFTLAWTITVDGALIPVWASGVAFGTKAFGVCTVPGLNADTPACWPGMNAAWPTAM